MTSQDVFTVVSLLIVMLFVGIMVSDYWVKFDENKRLKRALKSADGFMKMQKSLIESMTPKRDSRGRFTRKTNSDSAILNLKNN